jgi:5-hydroxyisourate hydrolase-like protein (transthyretin family)
VRALLLAVVTVLMAGPGHAQMDQAMGKPLIDGNLEQGSVTVRVVDGELSKPLAGLTVELVAAEGKNLAARTNPSGRATFSELKTDAAYVGRVKIPDKDGGDDKILETEPFRVPAEGGVRFLLSPKPLTGNTAAPAPAGGQPQMDPRRASGMPRPEAQDPPGRLTVRAVFGEFHPTDSRAPVGAKIHLVGFAADGTVELTTKVMDDSERVRFDGLATGGQVVYYAVALFERDGVVDRLVSQPITMLPRVGMRLLLSGEKQGSGKPAVDDLSKLEQMSAPAPGHVVVRVAGQDANRIDEVELVEVGNPQSVGKARLQAARPGPDDIQGMSSEPRVEAQQAELAVISLTQITGSGPGQPLAGIKTELRRVDDDSVVASTVTGSDGFAKLAAELPADKRRGEHVVVLDVFGKTIKSKVFPLPEKGGVRIRFNAAWRPGGLQAEFDGVAAGGDRVYVARLRAHGRVFRSTPFQLSKDAGAGLSMIVYPGLIFSFHGGAELDDENFWFQNQFTLFNPGKEPYLPPGGKVEIPLPAGFKAARVEDEMSRKVQVTESGLAWKGPVPPGASGFIATYAVPVDEGTVDIDMPLPMGAFRSQLILRKNQGMTLVDAQGNPPVVQRQPDGSPVQMLGGVPVREASDREGRPLLVLSGLNITRNEKLVLGIRGLPQRPGWTLWAKIAVSALVLILVGWGIWGVYRSAPASAAIRSLEDRREQLFDRIVALKRAKGDHQEEIESLSEELRQVYRQLDASDG